MTSTRLLTALAAALLLVVSSARASTPKVFQYDQWSSDFNQALSEINGQSVHTQPGFVQGEAFGVVFKPRDQEYPIEITGIQLIMAAPPMAPDLTANAMIEIYNSANPGPAPGVAPMFSISTQDLFNQQTQSLGLELIGNYGILIQFDLSDPENHPAFITEGNIWVVVRFTDAATDGLSSWGDIQCLQILPYTCGCQNVGTVQDSLITPHANVVDIITPAGQCSGSRQWAWMEDVGITGDVFLRLMTNVAKPPCEPDCTDKECGDDGCGGVCGPGCAEGLSCWDNACVSCVPDCTSKQCGDDGCGGSCGNCTGNRVCEDFFCVVPCTPDCAGRECGSDGCGGTCGPGCASGETCLSDGTCDAPCAPDCTGKRCGDDGCGGTCGPGCVSGQTCTAAGQCQTACAPACAGKDCGDDGCGGVCGTCSGDDVCHAGACEPLCAPACGGKVCGDDGCGGSCGTCAGGGACSAGQCVALVIDDVSPDGGANDKATAIAITGAGFEQGASVLVGGTALSGAVVTSSSLITASVPAGLEPDTYTVIVTNPGGATASLRNAFMVRAAAAGTGGAKDSGCAGGGAGGGALAWALSFAVAGLALSRRRRARG